MNLIAVAFGGALGACLRWGLSFLLNPIFPTLPLGTLVVNLLGGLIIGFMMGLLELFPTIPAIVRFGVITGFLGGLTTFSTFSAETTHLFLERNIFYAFTNIVIHVVGSLILTLFGYFCIKLIFGRIV